MPALTLALLVLAASLAQVAAVVAESEAQGGNGVAALQARLDWRRQYTLQIDGPAGTPFTGRYMQVYVSHEPSGGGTGNADGVFEGTTPYEVDLLAPALNLLFWRYSVVVTPQAASDVTVRVLDRGLR